MPTAITTASRPTAWLRSPRWDTGLLAFCWLPFYAWAVFGLGLGAESFGQAALAKAETRSAIALATVVVLGCSYVHRHYTLLLVYGDSETFERRRSAYIAAPLIVVATLLLARLGSDIEWFRAGKLRFSPWLLILTISGLWNVWHTVQQRYGILRAYASKAGRGLESRENARRDRWLLWTAIGAVAVVLLAWRQDTFAGHGNARRTLRTLEPLLDHPVWPWLSWSLLCGFGVCLSVWILHERRAALALSERAPRLVFLGSTFALLAVFLLHGPIVGYLCFGFAHAIEYLAFVHHFSAARRSRISDSPSLALRLLGGPTWTAAALIAALAVAYVVLREVDDLSVYLVYYFGASLLHFLYDGWIWKVRTPEVRQPLGIDS